MEIHWRGWKPGSLLLLQALWIKISLSKAKKVVFWRVPKMEGEIKKNNNKNMLSQLWIGRAVFHPEFWEQKPFHSFLLANCQQSLIVLALKLCQSYFGTPPSCSGNKTQSPKMHPKQALYAALTALYSDSICVRLLCMADLPISPSFQSTCH